MTFGLHPTQPGKLFRPGEVSKQVERCSDKWQALKSGVTNARSLEMLGGNSRVCALRDERRIQ